MCRAAEGGERRAVCGNHACIAALQAAVVYGMQNIVVETESQTLVKALQMCEYDLALGGVLFRETKFILSTSFNSSSVIHGYRSSQKKKFMDIVLVICIPSQLL